MNRMGESELEKSMVNEITTFPVEFSLEELAENISFSSNSVIKLSKEQIVSQGIKLHSKGNIFEAAKYYQLFIDRGYSDPQIFSNFAVIKNQFGERNKAIELLKKSIQLFPDNSESYSNLSILLKDCGKLAEAEIYARKAIELKPDFGIAYSNLGIILKDLGKFKEAKFYSIKALELDSNIIKAKLNMEAIAKKGVPEWHLSMMNDVERNNKYKEAIKLAVKENEYVLDIGTGSGLLSMMAIDAGAKKVITCEVSQPIAEAAKNIIQKNGYLRKIKVINKNSKNLVIGNDLPRKADLIISEILSSEFVGEQILSTISDANERLLKENGRMIPESGIIKCALLKCNKDIENKVRVGRVNGYDLSEFNNITGNKFNLPNSSFIPSFLSQPEIAFCFDFYQNDILKKQNKILQIKATDSGVCIGIITWFKLNLYNDISLENDKSQNSHWLKPIYTFNTPLEISKGQIIKINAYLTEDNVWFDLAD